VGYGASETALAVRASRAATLPTDPTCPAPTTLGSSPSLRLVTYNINGIKNKRFDVKCLLEETRCDVLALQETLMKATDWSLRFPGYQALVSLGTTAASTRGLALVISAKYGCYSVGRPFPFWVFARLTGKSLSRPVLVGCAYVPHRADRQHVLMHLPVQVSQLQEEYLDDPIILMGDFNMDLHETQLQTANWPVPLQVLANYGNVPTRRATSSRLGRTVDHIAFRGMALGRVQAPRVLDTWDMSDHFPVMIRMTGLIQNTQQQEIATPGPVCRPRIRLQEPPVDCAKIVSHNRWLPLAEEFEEAVEGMDENDNLDDTATQTNQAKAVLDKFVDSWEDTCHSVAEQADVVGSDKPTKSGLPRKACKAINKRRRCFMKLARAERQNYESPETEVLRQEYAATVQAARSATQVAHRKQWHKQILRAHYNMHRNPRAFWKWASPVAGWKMKSAFAGIQPIYNQQGNFLTNLPEIAKQWADHFGALAADDTGHSQDHDYWKHLDPLPHKEHLHCLDADISTHDVWKALRRMQNHKAPGMDGIPTNFLKACLLEEPSEEQQLEGRITVEQAPMTSIVRDLANLAFRHAVIPEAWQQSVVVAIPKKGDLADPNNYRGISLISSTLKVLLVVLTDRINDVAEAQGLFCSAQAGFRRMEECITQAACVLDIVQRRRIAGMSTFITFLDLKKAYDMVPHGCLFAKLSSFGVRGRLLAFLKALYASSTFQVRLGYGPLAQFSPTCQLLKGMQQGCPMSPVLFNIFMNDFPDGCDHSGVAVPTGLSSNINLTALSASCAMFADDVAGLSPTIESAIAFCEHVTEWTEKNEMKVGISKCGILECTDDPDNNPGILTDEHPLRAQLTFQGELVPMVQEYLYLGICLTQGLTIRTLVDHRLKLGKGTVAKLLPFLRCMVLPLAMRLQVVKSVLLPRLLFGAEVYGMNRQLTNRMQTLLNRSLKAIVGVSKGIRVASVTLWREVGILPICALAAGRRARAYKKCFNLRTTMGRLVHHPFRSRHWKWSSGIPRWISTHCIKHRPDTGEAASLPDDWKLCRPAELKKSVELCIAHRETNIRLNPSRPTFSNTQRYLVFSDYSKSSLCKARVGGMPLDHAGLALIVRCRMGAVILAHDLVKMGKLHRQFLNMCPCCQVAGTKETLEHLVLYCSRWESLRQSYVGTCLVRIGQMERRFPLPLGIDHAQRHLSWLLGGSYDGVFMIQWGAPAHETNPDVSELVQGDTEGGALLLSLSPPSSIASDEESNEVGSDPGDCCLVDSTSPVCLQVGLYLLKLMQLRQLQLRSLIVMQDSTHDEIPHSTTGQSSDG
jgi:exonuclease III